MVAGLAATLAGCANNPSEFMREPSLSPIGSGLAAGRVGEGVDPTPTGQIARPIANLYTDQTVSRVGDIVTVIISINDKAQFDNTTDRSKTAASKFNSNWGYTQGGVQQRRRLDAVLRDAGVDFDLVDPGRRATSTARSRSRSRWRRWSPR